MSSSTERTPGSKSNWIRSAARRLPTPTSPAVALTPSLFTSSWRRISPLRSSSAIASGSPSFTIASCSSRITGSVSTGAAAITRSNRSADPEQRCIYLANRRRTRSSTDSLASASRLVMRISGHCTGKQAAATELWPRPSTRALH